MNVAFMVGTNYLIYRIAKTFLAESSSLFVAFLYAVYPGAITSASVLTNQHVALFFMLMGVALLVQAQNVVDLMWSGLSLATSNLMRPEGIIILATIGCYGLLRFVQEPSMKKARELFISMGTVFAVYFGIQGVVGHILRVYDIAPNGIGNNIPEWKFVLGLDFAGDGGYSEKHIYIQSIQDTELRRETAKHIINSSFRESENALMFFIKKVYFLWTSPDVFIFADGGLETNYQVSAHLSFSQFRNAVRSFEQGAILLLYLLSLPAPFIVRKKQMGGVFLFCIAVVSIAFCAFLLIEIQIRYRQFVMPFLFVVSGITVEGIEGYMHRRKRKYS